VAIYPIALATFLEASARGALALPPVFDRLIGDDDVSWRLLWMRRHEQVGLSYAFDVYHPTRGWALRPGLKTVAFGDKRLTSNSRGVRGAAEAGYFRVTGRPRLLAFGDSFTFGEEVSDGETYVARLEHLLPGLEALNMGVHGYGHDQMLLYLREVGAPYRPDVVLLGFVDWDMQRNLLGFRDYAKPRFELVGGDLVLRGTPVPRPEQVLAEERRRSRFVDLLRMAWARPRSRLAASEAIRRRLTTALLDAFHQEVDSIGARLVIAYLPVEGELDPAAGETTRGESFLLEYCAGRAVQCIDVRPPLLAVQRRGVHLKKTGHWNRRIHDLAARALASELAAPMGLGQVPQREDFEVERP